MLNCAEETGSIPVPSISNPRGLSSIGRAPGFQPGGGGIVTRTLLQSMSPWCSTAARRSPKPEDAVRIRAGMPSMLRKRRQRRRSLVQTRARRESGAQLRVMHSKLTRWKRRAEDAETLARYQPSAPDRLRGGVSVARGAHDAEDRGRSRRPQPASSRVGRAFKGSCPQSRWARCPASVRVRHPSPAPRRRGGIGRRTRSRAWRSSRP